MSYVAIINDHAARALAAAARAERLALEAARLREQVERMRALVEAADGAFGLDGITRGDAITALWCAVRTYREGGADA